MTTMVGCGGSRQSTSSWTCRTVQRIMSGNSPSYCGNCFPNTLAMKAAANNALYLNGPTFIADSGHLAQLGSFCRRRGREARQGEVGLVIGDEYPAFLDF